MMLSSKLRAVEGGRIMFHCPGCHSAHMVRVQDGCRWAVTNGAQLPFKCPPPDT